MKLYNDTELAQKIGARLKELRESAPDRSLRDVSDEVGINHSYLAALERGEKLPSFSYFNTLLKYYRLEWNQFFKSI